MGQIIKLICDRVSVCQSVCGHSRRRISWPIFTKIVTGVKTPKSKNEFIGGSTLHRPFPHFAPKNLHFKLKGPEKSIQILITPHLPRQILDRKWNMAFLRMGSEKYAI